MADHATVEVTLVYSAQARTVLHWQGRLPAGSTVADAVRQSGVIAPETGSECGIPDVGIWGEKVELERKLLGGERVEIYRPLTVDPKVARRTRFAQQGSRTAGLFARPGKNTTRSPR